VHKLSFFLIVILWIAAADAAVIRGTVRDDHGHALPYVNVIVDGTQRGTTTVDDGSFHLTDIEPGQWTLRFTLLGFENQKLTADLNQDTLALAVTMTESAIELGNVDITTDRIPTGIAPHEPIRTEIISGEDIQARSVGGTMMSALEGESSLKTRPCAMCGSHGIGMQGMDASYTEVSVDGMPVFSGLGTLYGLDGLAAADVSQVEMVKGSGSNEAGSAAMAGALNLVSVKATDSTSLRASASVNQYGQNNVSASATGLLLRLPMRFSISQQSQPTRIDNDKDGVTDTPKLHRTNLLWSTALPNAAGGEITLSNRLYHERRFAGELAWSKGDRGSADVYGREVLTSRYEGGAGYLSRSAPTRFSLDAAWVIHEQDSWYGTTEFDAQQQIAAAKAAMDHSWSAAHTSTAQLAYTYQNYGDNLRLATVTDQRWSVPGIMVQHTWSPRERWTLQAGTRAEYYEEDGVVFVPRGSAQWKSDHGTTVRFSAGAGYRPVTIFSLDEAVMMGFEDITLDENLRAERSTSFNLNLHQAWTGRSVAGNVDVNAFYTHFDHKAIIAFGSHHNQTVYTNADRAYNRGVEVQARVSEGQGWSFKAGATRSEMRYRANGRWRYGELQHIYSGDARLGKIWRKAGIKSELSADVVGPQYLPEGRSRVKSPPYVLWDATAAKTWNHFEVTLAVKNIFDWTQSDNPYPRDPTTGRLMTDTALMYGPLIGRTVFCGVSYFL